MALFSRILVAYDGSAGSERALTLAAQLAGDQSAALTIYSVVERVPRFAGTVDEVDETVREETEALAERQRYALQVAAEYGVVARRALLETGHPAQLIVTTAERERADLLVLGRSGHSEVWGRFMGSTADKIARHASCAVLIAH